MPHGEHAGTTMGAQLEALAAEELLYSDEVRRIQQHRELLLMQKAMFQRCKTVYSLPTEVLLHIFHFFVQWDDEDWQCGEEIDWRPIILSHVCSTWRHLVLSTSSLWICLDFSRYPAVRPLITRSKEQHVDIVHAVQSLPGYRHDNLFESILRNTSSRWRSLLWESTESRMTDVLSVLHSGICFPHLRSLELGISKRTLPSVLLSPSSAVSVRKDDILPKLRRICLANVSLAELPPSHLPSLCSLTLHFPMKYPISRANLFRMSNLRAFLARTSQLDRLVFSDSTPLLDVFVRFDAKPPSTVSEEQSQQTSISVTPLTVPTLRRFEWSHAPPRDLWRFLAVIHMPSLKELELCLDAAGRRWHTYYAAVLEPMGDEPFSPRPLHPVIRLEQLEELAVFATDVDGLGVAFRNLDFPHLKQLTLGFLKERARQMWQSARPKKDAFDTPTLPPQEGIFREPRMLHLTHLTLSNYRLDRVSIVPMLAYMPSLKHLTMESCERMFQVLYIS
jgi:hypothetical protein